jgi:NADH-quinone oxidoreductase subunit L
MTHAFFKAQLFLGSGSVIHGTGTQDMREMGGLKKKMPVTYWTFLISTLALAGIPFTAGGFSKEEILSVAFHTNKPVFIAGLLGAFMTAFYMFRLVYKTFHGEPRNHDIHAHESPKVMLLPLMILASLAILSGYVGTPWGNVFEHNIGPVLGHPFEKMLEETLHGFGYAPGFSMTVFLIGTLAALAGIGLATIIWYKPILKVEKLEPAFGWLAKIVENKYYIDEIYQATVIRTLMLAAAFMYWFDKWVIDYAIVNGVGYLSLVAASAWGWFDKNIVDGIVNLVGWITRAGGRTLRHLQTGVAQQYIFLMVVAAVVVCVTVFLGHRTEDVWNPIARFFH